MAGYVRDLSGIMISVLINPPIVLSSSESSRRDREAGGLLANDESTVRERLSGVDDVGEALGDECGKGEEVGGEKAETRSDKNVDARL